MAVKSRKVNTKEKKRTNGSTQSKITGKQNKKTARHSTGTEKNYFSRIKQEFFDIDYWNKLTKKEKDYLAQFMHEFLGANLDQENPIHDKNKYAKDIYNSNNSRNRDIYARTRAGGMLSSIDPTMKESVGASTGNYEDELLDYIEAELRDTTKDQ